MRLILVGCEYSGTTTLAVAICKWGQEVMGGGFDFFLLHDHYKFPHTSGHGHEMTEEEQRQLLAISPPLKEMVQRHNIYYHIKPTNYERPDHILIGLHIEDAVYGPLYFGYGREDQPNSRKVVSPLVEGEILRYAPDTVLVLVEAAPEVIRRRMRENPHQNAVLQEKDVELVLRRFREEYEESSIRNKIELDTSSATIEKTVLDFAARVDPFLTEADRLRILVERARRDRDWL